MIRYKKDTDNIVTLILDMKGREKNVLDHEIDKIFNPVLDHLKTEKANGELAGVIITSGKKSFMAGGDLDYLHHTYSPQEIFAYTERIKNFFRELESPGVPVVAAINGSALGTGFELALACHHRIVVDHQKTRLGLPEVNLGIMPVGGAVVRLMWLLGIEKAFGIITSGKRYPVKESLEIGIIDEIVNDPEKMMDRAKKWILKNPEVSRPWDKRYASIPGGGAHELPVARKIRYMATNLSQTTRNNFDAPAVILQTLAEASKVDFNTASKIESRGFTRLVSAQRAKNMTQAFWYDFNEIRKGKYRPKGYGKFRPQKVGIIGSGRMGSGMATACVRRGLQVVIKDVTTSVAEKSRVFVNQALQELLTKGSISQQEYDRYVKQIITTDNAADFQGCDIILEAVFENEKLKAKVLKEAEAYIDEFTVYATNTSSIPISELGLQSKRPENVVGIHFFLPAESVPLVEIVKGKKTSEETIARAVDFIQRIKKIPIICKDSWGFYASRVKNTYLLEGLELLREGYNPALIENLGLQCGMPLGPLASCDEIGLKMVLRFETQAAILYGPKYIQHPAVEVLEKMINVLERTGANNKRGLYEYKEDGSRSNIWPELSNHFPTTKKSWDVEEIKNRLLYVQVIEAAWCMQEKVIQSEAEANLGSIHGWGFPSFSGGVLQHIEDVGREKFIQSCEAFEQAHGPRFKVPKYIGRIE